MYFGIQSVNDVIMIILRLGENKARYDSFVVSRCISASGRPALNVSGQNLRCLVASVALYNGEDITLRSWTSISNVVCTSPILNQLLVFEQCDY